MPWVSACTFGAGMAEVAQPKIPLIFFRTLTGNEPVREWLRELPDEERQAIGRDLLRAQWRWPVGMPLCRPMGNGLWEIRTDLTEETNGARVTEPAPRPPCRAAWVHQENARDGG